MKESNPNKGKKLIVYKKLLLACLFCTLESFSIYGQSNSSNSFFGRPLNLNIHALNDYSNFNYIDSSIKNSRIIFLGESSHTTNEYSLVKYKLIKYLNEKHNFDVILFESGIADCFFSDKLKGTKDSLWILRHSIFGIWWSSTTLELMNYIKSQQITLGGFDYQASTYKNTNSDFLGLNLSLDTNLTIKLFKLDTLFNNFAKRNHLFLDSNNPNYNQYINLKIELENLYERLSDELDSKKTGIDNTDYLLYKRIIQNKLFYIKNLGNSKRMYELRDSVMSNNILWFCDTLYKNKKIILWGANEHIAKSPSDIWNYYYAAASLPERIKKESYFIGLYAYSGEMFYNKNSFEIKTPKQNSLEGRIKKLTEGDTDVFLDLQHNYRVKGFEWLNKKTRTYICGKQIDYLVPINFYDGIILINKVSLNWNY